MRSQDRADPCRVHARRDPGVDPPSIALALDLERHMADGDVALFVDDGADPARVFELHRRGGIFRISDLVTEPRGTFASAQAAVREGWATVDAAAPALPPLDALLPPDPTGGIA